MLNLSANDGAVGWEPLIDRASDDSMVSVSPNREWIVYQSEDFEPCGIYMERLSDPGNRRAVSDQLGGVAPAWSRDGQEIYYQRPSDGAMMVVPVETSPELRIGEPRVLFEDRGYGGPVGCGPRRWDVGPDGRFLMIKAASTAPEATREFVIVQNWLDELNRLAPTD